MVNRVTGTMLNPPAAGRSRTRQYGGVGAEVLAYVSGHFGVLLAAALALFAVGWRPLWRWTRTVVTIAHEGGHALVAVLAGRGLTGIRLHPDTSGVTVSTGARRGPGLVLTFLAGYPAPSLLGLGGALLVADGRPRLMLWIAVGLLVRSRWCWCATATAGSRCWPPACSSGTSRAGRPPGSRSASPRPCAGSCCWAACAPPGSCGRGAAARRTPTCSPGSPTCPARCGGCSSGWWRARPWSPAAGLLLVSTAAA